MKLFSKKKPLNDAAMELLPEGIKLPILNKKTILEVLLRNKIEIDHSCDGMGSCGTCRIHILSDLSLLPERSDIELDMALDRTFDPNERLSCQTKPIENLKISISKNRN